MPNYYYEARKQDGTKVTGQRLASSAEALATLLSQEQITPIKIEECKVRNNILNSFNFPLLRKRVPLEEMLMFCQQMYTMNRAGVPIVDGVSKIAETTDNETLRETLNNIVAHLGAGKSFAVAMEQHNTIFSNLFINIVRVGENSGRLDEAFLQLSEYLKLEERTFRQLKNAVRYPSFVIIAIFIAILVINFLVVPAFSRMFEQFNAKLPLPTRIIVGVSNFFTNYWYLLLFIAAAIVIGTHYYLKSTKGRFLWHRLQLKIKIIGPILKRIYLARFSRTFALVLRTGVPIAEGLQLVGNALGNLYMKRKIQTMHEGITRGETISLAATNTKLFTPLVLQMIAVGEETGNIDEMLVEVAEFYERQVDYDLSRLGDAIEPILLIVLGIMVLILALGVFLPIWNMVQFAK